MHTDFEGWGKFSVHGYQEGEVLAFSSLKSHHPWALVNNDCSLILQLRRCILNGENVQLSGFE